MVYELCYQLFSRYFVNFSSFFLVSVRSFTSVIYVTKCQSCKWCRMSCILIIPLHAFSSTYMTCFVSSRSSSTYLWPAKILLTNVQFLWILLKILYSFLILIFSFFGLIRLKHGSCFWRSTTQVTKVSWTMGKENKKCSVWVWDIVCSLI